jgi:hypothetical protein
MIPMAIFLYLTVLSCLSVQHSYLIWSYNVLVAFASTIIMRFAFQAPRDP